MRPLSLLPLRVDFKLGYTCLSLAYKHRQKKTYWIWSLYLLTRSIDLDTADVLKLLGSAGYAVM